MMSEHELDDRLARAKRSELSAPDMFFDTLHTEITQVRGSSRAPRKAAIVAIVGALVVGGAALPAAAEGLRTFLAQADFFPEAGGEVIPDSEWVDTAAPDFPEYVITTLWSDATLPPGMIHDEIVERIIKQNLENPGTRQEVGIRRAYEVIAQCGWMSEWRQSTLSGDDEAARAAAIQLQAATTWRALIATDGGGIMDFYREVAEAAASGDARTVAASPLHRDCQIMGEESR